MAIFKQFVVFLAPFHISYRSINDELVCAFIEHIAERVKSPATIRNYVSALSVTYQRMRLCPHAFGTTIISNALLAVDKTIRHVPTPATYVTITVLKDLIQALVGHEYFATLKNFYLLSCSCLYSVNLILWLDLVGNSTELAN